MPEQPPAPGDGTRDSETVAALNRRMAAAEQNLDEMRQHFAAELHNLEQSVEALAAAVASARTAIAQTDDLLERVVDALALQPAEGAVR